MSSRPNPKKDRSARRKSKRTDESIRAELERQAAGLKRKGVTEDAAVRTLSKRRDPVKPAPRKLTRDEQALVDRANWGRRRDGIAQ